MVAMLERLDTMKKRLQVLRLMQMLQTCLYCFSLLKSVARDENMLEQWAIRSSL